MKFKEIKKESSLSKFKEIISWILSLIVLLFIGRSVISLFDRLNNFNIPFVYFRESVVATKSMQNVYPDHEDFLKDHNDRIYAYDLVCYNDNYDFESLQKYDVVVYRIFHEGKSILICHRVIDKYIDDAGVKRVVTRGDANRDVDGAIPYDDILGKVYMVIPKIGYVLDFFTKPVGALAVFGTLISISAGALIIDSANNKTKNKKNS